MTLLSYIPTEEVQAWCAAEVERQGDPPQYIPHMVEAWKYGIQICNEQRSITEDDVHILGGLVKGHDRVPYRETPVTFANGSHGLEWFHIKRQMTLLIIYQDDVDKDEFIKRFLDIHPFEDGNGRVAALLWNIKNGTLMKPVTMPDFYKK